ncbi:unnamed protein product [Calicophoron daubneyi]|uniref:Arrestin C-terminal-like domain-containing protein n=1 Tax=Calicophoron daubneyi TaxID=300641 RepID=A0AAV2T529_CALDB
MSTRRSVYKKNSPNNKLVVYLCARDIFDDLESVDPIEGVITMDSASLRETKVFARIRCTFRYGEHSLDDVLSGVTFFKEFFIETKQIYPRETEEELHLTDVQKKLVDRFGESASPFCFTLPHDIPASITVQSEQTPVPEEHPCGIEYVLQVFIGTSSNSSVGKRNSVSLSIRRLTLARPNPSAGPYIKEAFKSFHFHSGEVKCAAMLPKEIFYHGETIPINLRIDNHSSNTVRRVRFQVIQLTEVTLFKQRTTKCTILDMECEDGFPVAARAVDWQYKFSLKPSLQETRNQAGLALDGKLKHEDTTLASSTLIKDFRKKDAMAMVVQYFIRVTVITGFGGRNLELEIPFILTHKRTNQTVLKAEVPDEVVIEKFKRAKAKHRQESEDK